jgi:transcriptional regulator with PAS, ATPase and Fis domain
MSSIFNNKQFLQNISCFFNRFPFGICVVDNRFTIRYCNNVYSQIVEKKISDLIGTHIDSVASSIKYIPDILLSGVADLFRRQKYVVNGKERECIISKIPIKHKEETIGVMILVLFADIPDFYSFIKSFPKFNKEFDIQINQNLEFEKKYTFDDIIGNSGEITLVKEKAAKYAHNNATVLITGESGTGKELFAYSIHNISSRKNHSFIKVNCAALQDELLLSELFGYTDGSFTGAKKGGKKGKFELAHKGTIFLDEVGELSASMQGKLLNVLQEKEIDPIGSDKPIKVDIRVIAATNRDLEKMVDEGKFRLDLFYRLNILILEIPALRERKSDIPLITKKILRDKYLEFGLQKKICSDEFIEILMHYDWRGNIRELNNVLIHSIWNSNNDYLSKNDLPQYISNDYKYNKISKHKRKQTPTNLREALQLFEQELIEDAILENDSLDATAKSLGISKRHLYRKINDFKIEVK